jgi:hypothetical protein
MHRSSTRPFTRPSLGASLFLPLILALAAPMAAAGNPAFQTSIEPDGITWQPQIDAEHLVLVVSGPDQVYLRQEFDATAGAFLSPFDAQGKVLPDGIYSYELRALPRLSAELRAAVQAVREAGDTDREAELEARLPQGAVQFGYFTVLGGQIVRSDLSETAGGGKLTSAAAGAGPSSELTPMPSQVVLTNGDGVIRNSLCVGFDCPDSPTFSDTTILLMENNTRIKFDDTSSLGGFPNRDWSINANDSASGGANRLWIQDCGTSAQGGCSGNAPFSIEAGARNNALYVESDGDVGLGTSNPVVDLHIVTGNTPTLRLEQDGSSGFAPQTWDIAGNETNFFIRDVTGGSRLPLRIRPGAPTSALDIAANGNVGINEASPQDRLHISGPNTAALGFRMDNTVQEWAVRVATNNNLNFSDLTNGGDQIRIQPGAAPLSLIIANNGAGAVRVGINDATPSGTLDVNGTIFLSGAQIHPDFVFEPGYELETIEEHAESMWKNKYLPAMGPGEYDESGQARFELGKHQVGLLEELEKAHIYIEQLHGTIQKLEAQGEHKDQALASLEARLAKVEAVLEPQTPSTEIP